ncbi:MAG: DEAD/DEAH box helicase, partial [Candidatus Norongarragalinales archaeon]
MRRLSKRCRFVKKSPPALLPAGFKNHKMDAKITFQEQSVRAKARNKAITLSELADLSNAPAHLNRVQQLRRAVAEGADKSHISALKDALGFFIPTGFCPVGHNDADITNYTGLVCIDIDGDKSTQERARQSQIAFCDYAMRFARARERNAFTHVIAFAVSPTGCGLKVIVQTTNTNPRAHKHAAKCAREWFARESDERGLAIPDGAKFDDCAGTLSQPHYLTCGLRVYDTATPLPIPSAPARKEQAKATPAHTRKEPARARIVEHDLTSAPPALLNAHRALVAAGAGKKIEGYANYLAWLAAYVGGFGKRLGGALALELLQQSEAFNRSNFAQKFAQKIASLDVVRSTGARILVAANALNASDELAMSDGEFVSDALMRLGVDAGALAGRALVCPTGAGKTYAVRDLAQSDAAGVVFVAPTRLLAKQAAGAGGAVWFGGAKSDDHLADALNCKFIATTYHSLPSLLERAGELITERLLVIDEAHNLAASASADFMHRAITNLCDAALQFKRRCTLTATPYPTSAPAFSGLRMLRLTRPQKKATARAVKVDGVTLTEAAAVVAAEAVAAGRLVVIYMNDKGAKLLTLRAHLEARGVQFVCVNADERESEAFTQIVVNSKAPAPCIVATSVIREGVSLHDVERVHYICVGGVGAIEFEQLIARARGAEVWVDVLHKSDGGAEATFERERITATLHATAASAVNELNNATQAVSDVEALRVVAPPAARYNYDAGAWMCDALLLDNSAYAQEQRYYSANPRALAVATQHVAQWAFEAFTAEARDAEEVRSVVEAQKKARAEQTLEALKLCDTPAGVRKMKRRGGGFALAARMVATIAAAVGGWCDVARAMCESLLSDAGNAAKAATLARQVRVWAVIWAGAQTPARAL